MAGECSAEILAAAAGSSSPCFDISEFLGSPRKEGGSSNDEVFSNLSGLNLSPSSFSMLPPLPLLIKSESHEPDLSALLLDEDGQQQHAAALEEIESQLQAAAAAAAAAAGEHQQGSKHHQGCAAAAAAASGGSSAVDDELAMFAAAAHHHHHHDMNLVNTTTSSPASYYHQEARLLNYPHHHHHRQASSMFGQHGSFLAADGGDNNNIAAAAATAAAAAGGGGGAAAAGGDYLGNHHHHLASSLRGDVASFPGPASAAAVNSAAAAGSNAACDWGVLCEGPAHHHHHVHPATHNCDLCQILRCIIHSNGVQDTKLEIHGFDNISYHAVLHTRFCIDDGFPTALEQQMVEFPVGNGEYVRQFLLQYSLLRRKEGFVLRHDSMSSGVDQNSGFSIPDCGFNTSGPFLSKQIEFGSNVGQSKHHQSNNSEHGEPSATPANKPPKSNAAAQRERTGKLKMSDLAQHFHLPINAAAKELGICPTVLKKICRRNGMRRWPHRKIKSIERIIATLEQTIAEGAGQGDEGIRMEIAMLRNERQQLCAGLLGQN